MDRTERREGPVAVAIDRDKSSQFALKWAVDHHIPRGTSIRLVHVVQRSSLTDGVSPDNELRQPDAKCSKMFLSLRCFCMRRNIQAEIVLLEEQDVAKALIEYVTQNGISTLLLGATQKKSITRLFKAYDIPSNVMRWAPDFCNVLVISKGKLSSVRSATRPLPLTLLSTSSGTAAPLSPNIIGDDSASVMSLSREDDVLFEELSAFKSDVSAPGTDRQSTDSAFLSFYENLGSAGGKLHQDSRFWGDLDGPSDLPSISECGSRTATSSENGDEVQNEMRRLKMELKQTIDMYHVACKEVLTANQKVKELEIRKNKLEQLLEEAQMCKETTSAIVEFERSKFKAAIEQTEAAQRTIELEVRRRVDAEMRAEREAEERKKLLDALGKSHIVVKYESLLHILLVVFLFYFYFLLFR